jgi:hypothetical protein
MANGGERSCNIRHRHVIQGRVVPLSRPLDHDDRQAEPSRRFDLAIARAATGVFRDHRLDAVFFQYADFVVQRKGAARGNVARMRQFQWRLHRVDAADEIVVLGRGFERKKLLSAERQKYMFASVAERGDSLFDAIDIMPPVTRLTLPGGTREDDQRNFGKPCGLNGIGGNLCRIGMGGVHQNIETLGANEIRETNSAAKTAAAHRHRLFDRRQCAAGHGEQDSVAGVLRQPAGQNAGIRRATKDEYGACHDV